MNRRCIYFVISIFILNLIAVTPSQAAPKPFYPCSKLNQTEVVQGIKFTCIKSGVNLWWDSGAPVKQASKVVDKKQAPIISLANGDSQHFYATYACHNKIMFARYDNNGRMLRQVPIVVASGNYQLIPKFYISGTLLFETFDCTSNSWAVYTVDLTNVNQQPQQVWSGSDTVLDSTIDIATKTPLILLINNQGVNKVVTGGLANTTLWTSQSNSDFHPDAIVTQTGYQFLLFGNYLFSNKGNTGFGGYLVDVKQNWVSPYAYAPQLTLTTATSTRIAQGFGWNSPLAFDTSQGIFVCGMPATNPLNPLSDSNCVRVTTMETHQPMAFSLGSGGTLDLIAGNTIYDFDLPSLFSTSAPTFKGSRQNPANLGANNNFVSTFEISKDLGAFKTPWNFFGTYFSQN